MSNAGDSAETAGGAGELKLLLERRTAELRASERRFETLLLHMPAGVIIVSESGRILVANAAAGRLFDRKDTDLRDYELGLPLPSEEPFPVQICRRDGALRTAELVVRPLMWDDAPAFVACLREVAPPMEPPARLRGCKQPVESLRGLAARLQVAREQERELTSREVDDVYQLLAAANLALSGTAEELQRGAEPGAVLECLQSALSVLSVTQETSYRLLLQLRPGIVDDLGLAAAMDWYAGEFSARTGVPVVWDRSDGHALEDPQARIAAFRLFQQALANVERHAGASEVRLSLRRRGGMLLLRVRDNGRGISREEATDSRSLGIVEMRETALLLGGHLRIAGSRGAGTTLTLRIPVDARVGETRPT